MEEKRENKVVIFTIAAVVVFMWWMIALRFFIRDYFVNLFRDFGLDIHPFTELTFKSISIWYVVIFVVVITSFLAAFSKTKIKYLGVLIPVTVGILHLIGLYVPIFILGIVI